MELPGIRIIREEETRTARIRLWHNGIVLQVYKKGVEVEGDDILDNVNVFWRITGGLKLPFIFVPEEDVVITRDAREVGSMSERNGSPVKAVALIAPNIAYRLLADFYMRFHKPVLPYKVFSKLNEDVIKFLLPFVPAEFSPETYVTEQ